MDANITTSEKELLFMLLQREEKNLHVEINHAAHREFKLFLKERLQMVTTLMEKLKVAEHYVAF
jgi:hypothetical protein